MKMTSQSSKMVMIELPRPAESSVNLKMSGETSHSERSNLYGGFTLLEMVVAIGIFAIIAVISYSSLVQFIDTRETIESRHEELAALQMTMTLIGRDARFMINRPVRDSYGDEEAMLLSGESLALAESEFFRLTTSHPDPRIGLASRSQRVGWRLQDGDLQRVRWDVLDRDEDSKEYIRTVLTGVSIAEVRYYTFSEDGELETTDEWDIASSLPAGIEFLLTMDSGKEYRRVFAVAGSS